MATDTEDLVLSISADVRQMQRALDRMMKDTDRATTAVQKSFDDLGGRTAGSFNKAAANSNRMANTVVKDAGRVQQAMKASSFQTANLTAQLQDIAVQLQGGASPLTIAMQQGTQIVGALGSSGAAGAVSALGGAFMSLVNPVSLATVGIIALGGYAVQYFTKAVSGGEDANKALKEHADLVKRIAERWGAAVPELKKYSDRIEKLAQMSDIRAAGEAAAAKKREEARAALVGLDKDMRQLAQALRLAGAPKDEITTLMRAFQKLREEMDDDVKTAENAEAVYKALNGSLRGMTPDVGAYAERFLQVAENMRQATGEATKLNHEAENLARTMAVIQQLPGNLGHLSPLFSGGGKFLNQDQFNTFRAGQANLSAAGGSAAAQMIRGFEGFRTGAYWDKNAYRVGFGSDTATRANGMIEKVTKDTIVTLDDAERDLSRRILEFQGGIQQAIGIDTWRSLNDAQQAALTSIAYNYGQLPKKVVEAIKSGGGPEAVAKSIADLSANPARRKEEAQAFLSGSGYSLADVGLGGKKTPDDLFKGSMEEIQRRIALLNAEAAAQATLNPAVNDYGFAVQKARIEQQLLNDAAKAGVEVTPQLRAQIDELATNYAKASSSAEQLKASQQQAAQAAQQLGEIGKTAVNGLVNALADGKIEGKELLQILFQIVQQMLSMPRMPGAGGFGLGGGGGLLGGMIIPGILHSGGTAGVDGYGHGRRVPASAFIGATRYHSGGIAGKKPWGPNEIPAILERGEPILPKGSRLGGSQAIHVTVGVSADNNGNLMPFVESVSERKAAQVTRSGIAQYDKQAERSMGGRIARAQARQL